MLSSATRFRARGTVVLFLFVVAAVMVACGGAAAPGASAGAPGGVLPGATAGPAPQAGQGNGDGQGLGNGEGGGEAGVIDQAGLLIVKDGSLAIQVEGLNASIDAAGAQIAALGGYASASQRFGDGDAAQASVTYRIPVARWEEALSGLRSLGQKVIDERYSTEEVTAQVVDLGARVTNLQSTEAALQAIMDRAVDIEDVLTVQAELTEVRSEIERLTAQRTNLEGRAAFSTLTVTFALRQDPILAEQQGFDAGSEVERASASLVAVLQAVATAGIWFGIVWLPIILVMGAIALVTLAIARRVQRSRGETSITPAAGTGA